MNKILLSVAATLFSASLSAAPYALDGYHSEVGFKVKHLMISTVPGKFKSFSGGFDFNAAKGQIKDVSVTVDVTSIDTGVEMRDKHLRSGDFFDAEKNPSATFLAEGPVKVLADKAVKVPGTLTLRGVTKPVVLEVTYGGSVVDPMGKSRVAFEAETKINRSDFGVSWNKQMDKGGVMISEEVRIVITGEATLVEAAKADKK
jgi:polyisoprenoid-binding protein YceI